MSFDMATKVLYRRTSSTKAPNAVFKPTGVLDENDQETADVPTGPAAGGQILETTTDPSFKPQLVWRNIIIFIFLHMGALYGAYLALTGRAQILTLVWAFSLYIMGGLGITAGAHRLWAHRSYKATLPLRIILVIFQTIAFQNDIHEWCRDHRVHHKFSETDADPHNAKRGFFFAHMGWLCCRKHPYVFSKGKCLEMKDIEEDAAVDFQRRFYLPLVVLLCFVVPTVVPCYFWGEKAYVALYVAGLFRYTWTLHMTWLVNSAAHMWGNRPYDETINPSENVMVAVGAIGEGWHNYHHVFPWDYKAAELGNYRLNLTTAFIDACFKLGLASELKTVPKDIVMKRVQRTGDGSHPVWGWGDRDMSPEDAQMAYTIGSDTKKAE